VPIKKLIFLVKTMSISAINVANAFISFTEPEKGDLISNLKVQKMLYYVQGYHLALYDDRFFNEEIIAWQYGPVVPDVYHYFKTYGSSALPLPNSFDFDIFDENKLSLIKEVNDVYGQYSALKLMDMTHQEAPWKNTAINSIITPELLKDYFLNYI